MEYTNEHLYEGKAPKDHLFVVAKEPKQADYGYRMDIDLHDQAAVNDKRVSEYEQPYTVEAVRKDLGNAKGRNLWLLSGGTIIRDHRHRIAVGLRDGNAADPFKFTNIGAGRCDQLLETHCYEEMLSEFVLCVRENGRWVQVQLLPPELPPLLREVRESQLTIALWKAKEIPNAGLLPLPYTKVKESTQSSVEGLQILRLRWTKDDGVRKEETLKGYIHKDPHNHTLEFRLALGFDLSTYEPNDVAILYAEGTGYAAWKSEDELRQLADLDMVTPLLRALLL